MKLAKRAVNGGHLLLGIYPLTTEKRVTNLTEGKRGMLTLMLAGSTNLAIAQRRHTNA
ncbi:MAG: hypothetical protein KC590_03950 [Nitrospira sp.]|nr:hypothetical protein [Nitrospira sp.]